MRTSLLTLAAAASIAAVTVAAPDQAEARCYGCWAGAGVAAGVVAGAAIANAGYYGGGYAPGYYGGGYAPAYYGYRPYYAPRYYAPRYYAPAYYGYAPPPRYYRYYW